MDKKAQNDMQVDQEPFATVWPVGIMSPFKEKQDPAAGNGQVMPCSQALMGSIQHDAAKHDAGHGNMGRPGADVQPPDAV